MRVSIQYLVLFSFFISLVAPAVTNAEIQGAITGADLQCYAGLTGIDNGFTPRKEGEVCYKTPVGNNEALALECAAFKDPVVTSTCRQGKCVATHGCDGKLLTGTPDLDAGKPDPLKPTPTPTTPTPTTPPTLATPSPVSSPSAPTPSPGSGSVSGGSVPAIPTRPSSGATGSGTGTTRPNPGASVPQGPSYALQPGSGSTGSRPNGADGMPGGDVWFPGNNTTFSGSGLIGAGSGSGASGFVSLISNILSTFLPLFTGGSSLSSQTYSESRPTPSAPSSPQVVRPPLQVAGELDPRTLSLLDALEQGRPSAFPIGPLTERTGLDALVKELGSVSLTGGPPQEGGKLTAPPSMLQNPDDPLPPKDTRPIRIIDVADATSPDVLTDFGGITVPNTNGTQTSGQLNAQERNTNINRVFTGLADKTILAGSAEVEAARELLIKNLSLAKQTRDRAYLESSLNFYEFIDRFFSVSPGQRAVDAAEARLSELSTKEGAARIAELAGGLEVPSTPQPVAIAPGVTVEFTDKKIDETGFRPIPSPLDVVLAIYARWTGPAVPIQTPGAQPIAPTPTSATLQLESRSLLDGLSAVASRAIELTRNAARSLAERLSPASTKVSENTPAQNVPPPVISAPPISLEDKEPLAVTQVPPQVQPSQTPEAAPTKPPEAPPLVAPPIAPPSAPSVPPPVVPAAPPNASARSGGFFKGGLNLLSALVQGITSLFSNSGSGSGKIPTVSKSIPTPSAAIVANPLTIDAGKTTKLSWTSVGALSCVIVDTELRFLAGDGVSGDVISPMLSKSTRFGVICDIAGGKDKFVNETLVRVRGDASDPKPLFAQQGRISQSVATGIPAGVIATSTQDFDMQAPLDVRTCEPDQSMESFIRCLCDAEPNPNGCALVPR